MKLFVFLLSAMSVQHAFCAEKSEGTKIVERAPAKEGTFQVADATVTATTIDRTDSKSTMMYQVVDKIRGVVCYGFRESVHYSNPIGIASSISCVPIAK